MVEPVLKLSQRAYLGAQAVEVMEKELELEKATVEVAVNLLEEVLKAHPNIPLSRKIRPFVKSIRGV